MSTREYPSVLMSTLTTHEYPTASSTSRAARPVPPPPGLPLGHMRAHARCCTAPRAVQRRRALRVGADAERKLDVYRDYLYHLDQVRGTHGVL